MPTNGRRIASSPTVLVSDLPSASTTSAATDGEAVLNPAGLIGLTITLDSSAPDTSVPPV
ncbi:hypothetical protein D3C81_1397560 [compost metagenome]